jgi:hypothetical protein
MKPRQPSSWLSMRLLARLIPADLREVVDGQRYDDQVA